MDSLPLTRESNSLSLDEASTPARKLLPPASYYVSLHSLYSNLDERTISDLEKAILYSKVRAFKESALAFDAFQGSQTNLPVIVFERFLDYMNQWRLYDATRVLENGLAATEGRSADLERSGIYILFRIYLAQMDVFTKGNFTRARNAMLEVKEWLAEIPIEDYTDIQVG